MKRLPAGRRTDLERARACSDDALVEDLHRLGVTIDQAAFREAARLVSSPDDLAHALNHPGKQSRPLLRGADLARLRVDLTALWERWLPDRPTFAMIDDWMQAGYEEQARGNDAGAADHWLRTWTAAAIITRQRGYATIEEFDEAFGGAEYLYNYVQDMDGALHNAGLKEPRFWEESIRVAEEVLGLFPNEDSLFTENRRRTIAESHAKLGRREISDRLYRAWLEEDRAWGWGWIGWSDTYFLAVAGEARDAGRAEAILREGLAQADVCDSHDLLVRLAVIYEETGRGDEAAAVRREAEALEARQIEPSVNLSSDPRTGSRKVSFDFGEAGPPLERLPEIRDRAREILAAAGSEVRPGKVGRNEPCPCGSGRKYKKCCGR